MVSSGLRGSGCWRMTMFEVDGGNSGAGMVFKPFSVLMAIYLLPSCFFCITDIGKTISDWPLNKKRIN